MTEAVNQGQIPCNSEINSFLIGYNGSGLDQIDFRPTPGLPEKITATPEPAEPNLSDLAAALATTEAAPAVQSERTFKRNDVTFSDVMTAERKRITSEIAGLPSVDLI
jgi:hypothetical protein